jgi:mycofactocin precursor
VTSETLTREADDVDVEDVEVGEELLVEEVSIDGLCGVY